MVVWERIIFSTYGAAAAGGGGMCYTYHAYEKQSLQPFSKHQPNAKRHSPVRWAKFIAAGLTRANSKVQFFLCPIVGWEGSSHVLTEVGLLGGETKENSMKFFCVVLIGLPEEDTGKNFMRKKKRIIHIGL